MPEIGSGAICFFASWDGEPINKVDQVPAKIELLKDIPEMYIPLNGYVTWLKTVYTEAFISEESVDVKEFYNETYNNVVKDCQRN